VNKSIGNKGLKDLMSVKRVPIFYFPQSWLTLIAREILMETHISLRYIPIMIQTTT
jgi:hypothetical protein